MLIITILSIKHSERAARVADYASARAAMFLNGVSAVLNDLPLGLPSASGPDVAMSDAGDVRLPMGLAEKAERMHMHGRLRSKHFFTPVMADSAMDVMLSLFVGELQSSPVSSTVLAVGNLLNRQETDALIDSLVQAGLVVVTGLAPDRRTVGLSPLGSARMRSFVNDYPDV